MTVALCDQTLERMEKFLAEDKEFKEEVKKLEQKFGELVSEEMRERLHLEKNHLMGSKIVSNLEDALRNLVEAEQENAETAELLNADTEKLKIAFYAVANNDRDQQTQVHYGGNQR